LPGEPPVDEPFNEPGKPPVKEPPHKPPVRAMPDLVIDEGQG
jgi:hypothetical protein